MSALASAPLEPAAPARLEEAGRRRHLWLAPTPVPILGSRLPTHILETWECALDADGRALDAAASMNVYTDEELVLRRHRLRDERGWLAGLSEMKAYDPLPQVSGHP